MMLLLSVLTMLRYHEYPAMSRLLVAAAASSAALFVKPGICLFQIFGVFVALMVYRKRSIRALTSVHLLARQGQGAAFPGKYVSHGTTADYELRAEIYREIGEIVNHSPKTIVFASDCGYSLAYHGRVDGLFLYPESKTIGKDLAALHKENSPRYAIVIKRFAYDPRQVDWRGRWKRDKDLRSGLARKFGVEAEDRTYIVFDLRETSAGKPEDTE